jgi:FAD/FMN-containing dehydrogenase
VPLEDDLVAIVGSPHVLVDPSVRASYETDWTGRFRGEALAVVRPGTVDEVVAVLKHCDRHGVAVVPQGGNTGLVAGAVPPAGSVVLSLRRLEALGPVDDSAGQVTVGAGCTLAALQRHLDGSGWAFGVDLAPRGSCTIGGMVATNAGGTRVLRHGAMRSQVLGVEAVLANGAVLRHVGGLVKDNTGYDLAGLLCGSEGTLGVVTSVRLRLVPDLPDRLVVLVALPSMQAAVHLASVLRRRVEGLDALEVVAAGGIGLVSDQLDLPPPFADVPEVALLVEWAGHGAPPAALGDVLGDQAAIAAEDAAGRAGLWRYREDMALAIQRVGVPHKLDVTLPIARLAAFAAEVVPALGAVAPGAAVHLFGHLGDGNLHVNVTGVADDDETADEAVLRLVATHGGSISAEHGIGRAKARWLGLSRTEPEIEAMRAIKHALDPRGTLNPGALLPERPVE